MIFLALYAANFYANYRIIKLLMDLFTAGDFRWAIAGFIAWVGIQSGVLLNPFLN